MTNQTALLHRFRLLACLVLATTILATATMQRTGTVGDPSSGAWRTDAILRASTTPGVRGDLFPNGG